MIIQIIESADTGAALDYAAGKSRSHPKDAARVVYLGGNIGGHDPRDLLEQFRLVQELAPRIRQNCRHIVITLSDEDRLMSPAELLVLGNETLRGLGYHLAPHAMWGHSDSRCQHIHAVTTQISLEGRRVKEGFIHRKGQRVAQKIEAAHDLVLAPRLEPSDPRRLKLGAYGLGFEKDGRLKLPAAGKVILGHLSEKERLGIPPGRLSAGIQRTTPKLAAGDISPAKLVKLAMDSLLPQVGSLGELRVGLLNYGINFVPDLEKGRIKFLVGADRHVLWGSKLDKAHYTLAAFERRGIRLDSVPAKLSIPEVQALAAPALPPPGKLGFHLGDLPQAVWDQVLRLRNGLAALTSRSSQAKGRGAPKVAEALAVGFAATPPAQAPALPEMGELGFELGADALLPEMGELGFELDADALLPEMGKLGLPLGLQQGPSADDQLPPPGKEETRGQKHRAPTLTPEKPRETLEIKIKQQKQGTYKLPRS